MWFSFSFSIYPQWISMARATSRHKIEQHYVGLRVPRKSGWLWFGQHNQSWSYCTFHFAQQDLQVPCTRERDICYNQCIDENILWHPQNPCQNMTYGINYLVGMVLAWKIMKRHISTGSLACKHDPNFLSLGTMKVPTELYNSCSF